MSPQEQAEFIALKGRIDALEKSDRYVLSKLLQFLDGRNIQTGRSTGTTIATSPDQKLSVFGATPVVQAGAIAHPTTGTVIDSQGRAAIDLIIDAVKAFGITA